MPNHHVATVPAWLAGVLAFAAVCGSLATAHAQSTDAAASTPVVTQSSDSGVVRFFGQTEVTGFADVYYGWRFNRRAAQLRNFDVRHSALSLNLVEIAFEKKPLDDSRVGFRVDLNGGPTARMVNAFEPGTSRYLKTFQQAYV